MDCEVCGSRDSARFVVSIEGAKLNACPRCARGAKVISEIEIPVKKSLHSNESEAPLRRVKMEQEVVDDYAMRIQHGLKAMGLDVNVLSEKMSVRHSLIVSVSQGRMMPDVALAKRLEKELNIKLVEDVAIETSSEREKKGNETTLGDIVDID